MKKKLLAGMIIFSSLLFAACSSWDFDEEEDYDKDPIKVSAPVGESETSETTEETTEATEETTLPSESEDPADDVHALSDVDPTYGDIPECYQKILDEDMYVLVGNIDYDSGMPEDFEGLMEAKHSGNIDSVTDETGYIIKDFDGNGVNELMIFAFAGAEDGEKAFRILSLYTMQENKDGEQEALNLLSGRVRKSYYMLPDGKIYHSGSNGAAYSIVGTYVFGEDGKSIVPNELYFTDYVDRLKDGTGDPDGKHGWFRSYDGNVSVATSEDCEYMGEDFEPAIKADFVEFDTTEYCLFSGLRHKYEIINEDCTWSEAEERCEKLGGHLVTIGSYHELRLIAGIIESSGYDDKLFFVGGAQNEDGSDYVWSTDGTDAKIDRSFWLVGEPSFDGKDDDGKLVKETQAALVFIPGEEPGEGSCALKDISATLHDENTCYICEYDY